MPLSMVKSGMSVVITQINKSFHFKNRLNALGIVKGTRLIVLKSEFGGPMVIEIRGVQLALGQEMLSGIFVETYSAFMPEVTS